MSIISGGAKSTRGGYQIARSLRFRASASPQATYTNGGAGSSTKGTLSAWVKRANIGTDSRIFAAASGGNQSGILFSSDKIRMFNSISGILMDYTTTAVYRDPSAWMHIVAAFDTTQGTASNRQKLYVNGVQVTAFGTAVNAGSSEALAFNQNSYVQYVNSNATPNEFFDGEMAEYHWIDGAQLDPTSFGQFNSVTGVWEPKLVSGLTYGTNGFYHTLSNNSSTANLGLDSSGNGRTRTMTNFSITAGVTNDSLTDTPTNYGTDDYLGGSVRGNYATLDQLWQSPRAALSNGNLAMVCAGAAANFETARATQVMTIPTYWETVVPADRTYAYHGILNVALAPLRNGNSSLGVLTTAYPKSAAYCALNGRVYYNSDTQLATYTAATAGQIIGHAYDPATGKYWVRVNGTWQNSGDPAAGTGQVATADSTLSYVPAISDATSQTVDGINFGQRPFANTAPTGFKALCTQNLANPAIAKPSLYMDVNTRSGTGAAFNVTGKGFQPDLVWMKGRSGATSHAIFDSVRGTQADLASDSTAAEVTDTQGLSAFNSDGFSGGTLAKLNTSAATYVDWCWKKGVTPGFDIVSYTGNGTARTISHALGVAPRMTIVKGRNTSTPYGWFVYHSDLSGANYRLELQSTAAQANGGASGQWNSTAPTSSVFSVGGASWPEVNENAKNHIAYLFAEVAGFSKFGSYTGNGSVDGPFVWCGFRPRWIMFKRTDSTGDWRIFDTLRGPYNGAIGAMPTLYANDAGAEIAGGSTWVVDVVSNGFKIRESGTPLNASGGTYIFVAFAEAPFKTARAR